MVERVDSNTGKLALTPKGYYVPMVLTNGEDFCQIDFTGSMGFKDYVNGYMSFWYKKGRPNAFPEERGIAKLEYRFHSDKGPVEIGVFSQEFDPFSAILKTWVSAYQLEMEIETFLTEDHTLIELYRVLKSESCNSFLGFHTTFPERSYTGRPILLLDYDAASSLCFEGETQFFRYVYKDDKQEILGLGMSSVRVLKGGTEIRHNPENNSVELANLSSGDRFIRVTTLVDSENSVEFESEAKKIHSTYMEKRSMDILNAQFSRYTQNSKMASLLCSNKEIQKIFDTSLYVCKASLHPNGSTVSALSIPNNHGMGTYWDVWFTHSALLRANRIDDAMKVIRFWDSVYFKAKKIAKEIYGVGGARFEWVLRCDGNPRYFSEQIHNNLIPVVNIFDQYLYTGDTGLLAERFNLMQDCVRFVLDFALRKDTNTGRYYFKELQAVDESDKKKRNELLTAIITRKAVDLIIKSAKIIGRKPEKFILESVDALSSIIDYLKQGGTYIAYEGADYYTWANILAFIHYPDANNFTRALELCKEGCYEKWGLSMGITSRMRCATFPWVEGIFAWAAARNKHQEAICYLKMMARFTNYFKGIPEYLFIHGEPSRDWFVAAHAVFVTAFVDLVVQREGKTITVFPCGMESLPKGISFSNVRLPGSMLVSINYGDSLSIRLENLSENSQEIILKSGGFSETLIVKAKSDYFKIIHGEGAVKTAKPLS